VCPITDAAGLDPDPPALTDRTKATAPASTAARRAAIAVRGRAGGSPSFNKAPREIRIGGDDRRHGFVSDLARYRDDREEVSCYRTPADDVPMNSSFWKEASTEAADAQVGVAAAVAVAQPRRLPVSPSVRSTWLSAAVTAALQGTAVSILSADAYGYGMICGMSKALTRDQTAALAASLAVVMERIRAEELGASAAATYRLAGALVAVRAVLGETDSILSDLGLKANDRLL
jgi:hypothetical protein